MSDAAPPNPSASTLTVRIFGSFRVERSGVALSRTRTQKEQWLLALLLLRHNDVSDRRRLSGMLWPDSTEARALQYLRRSLCDLRDVLGDDSWRLKSPTARTIRFDVSGAWVDVLEFDAAIARGTEASLQQAVELRTGSLLDECAEEWIIPEREARDQAYLVALESLASQAMARSESAKALPLLQKAVSVEPARETAQRSLMFALSATGDHAGMTQAYRDFRLFLHQELGVGPDAETTELYRRLRANARDSAKVRSGDQAPSVPPPRNIPCPTTTLIGREAEIHEIVSLLDKTRLLTLTGAGGVGKTRLAIAAADVAADEYTDGVWFVDLAPLEEPRVVHAAALALGLRDEPNRSLEAALIDHLGSRSLLLILDNCEHLIDACSSLAHLLLLECPQLHLLATSRQPLGVAGEQIWRVPTLTLLDEARSRSLTDADAADILLESEAARLFVERASAAHSTFRLGRDNARSVAEICRLMDGIPFALELAAASTRVMRVDQAVERLRQQLDLPSNVQRGSLSRRKTLEATLDWSYDLLNSAERTLLGRLSVFLGGWTLEAAEAVCSDEDALQDQVLEHLAGLVDKSLVVYEEERGEPRYHMLETTRRYAYDRLEPKEWQTIYGRHLRYYLTIVEDAELHFNIASAVSWNDRLEGEHPNFRAALDWSRNSSDPASMLRLGTLLCRFWYGRGYLTEGRQRMEEMLERGRTVPTEIRARALNGLGSLAFVQGDFRGAQAFQEESLRLFRDLQMLKEVAIVLADLGVIAQNQGDYEAAQPYYQEGLEIMRALDSDWGTSYLVCLHGRLETVQGAHESARTHLKEGLTLARCGAFCDMIAFCAAGLGYLEALQHDFPLARTYYQESLSAAQALGDKLGLIEALEALAGLAASAKQAEHAGLLWGAAENLRDVTRSTPIWENALTRPMREGSKLKDKAVFEKAQLEGRTWSLDQVLSFALRDYDA